MLQVDYGICHFAPSWRLVSARHPHQARALKLSEGGRIGVSVKAGKLAADPSAGGGRYRFEELLAQCDPAAPHSGEDEAWLADRPRGEEHI